MNVYAFIRMRIPKKATASDLGDIVYIYPIDVPQAKLDIQDFWPVVVDLNIPCGDNFRKRIVDQGKAYQCLRCQWNDPLTCDNIKYTKGVWTPGGLEEEPELTKKRRYRIDIDDVLSLGTEKNLALNDEKTEPEKITAFNLANTKLKAKTIIVDKSA